MGDPRQHSIENHKKIFRLENKSFENVTGIDFFSIAKPQSEASIQVSSDAPDKLSSAQLLKY